MRGLVRKLVQMAYKFLTKKPTLTVIISGEFCRHLFPFLQQILAPKNLKTMAKWKKY